MTAPAMTYDSLITDLQSYAERDDTNFVSQLPRFIMMAENRLATKVRGLGFLKLVSSTFEIGNAIVPKPQRWRETGSFWYQGASGPVFLKLRPYEYVRTYSGDAGAAEPVYYSDYGYEHYFLAGTPTVARNFELLYFERPEPLSELNQVNWTTQYAPQLILFGTLMEAQVWLKMADRAAEFKGLFDEAVAAVAGEAERRISDMTLAKKAD